MCLRSRQKGRIEDERRGSLDELDNGYLTYIASARAKSRRKQPSIGKNFPDSGGKKSNWTWCAVLRSPLRRQDAIGFRRPSRAAARRARRSKTIPKDVSGQYYARDRRAETVSRRSKSARRSALRRRLLVQTSDATEIKQATHYQSNPHPEPGNRILSTYYGLARN